MKSVNWGESGPLGDMAHSQGKAIDLAAGPPGTYLLDLTDWEFHEWLCDTSDYHPGEVVDLMKNHMPGCVNNPADIYDLRRRLWDSTGQENIECPLKFTKRPTPKRSTNTTKTPSSRTKSSADITSSQTQASSSRTQPSSNQKTSPRADTREMAYPKGWSTINNPAPEQRHRSPGRFSEPESRRSESLAFRPSPLAVKEIHDAASRSSRSGREADRRDGPDASPKPRTSDITISRPVAKRTAKSPDGRDVSKRPKEGSDLLRR
ncbi:hypothetical protein EAE96_007095 [Botrytis aclada]|nr:hypothetical protein EAE96_007095 [Botrytis aclada]